MTRMTPARPTFAAFISAIWLSLAAISVSATNVAAQDDDEGGFEPEVSAPADDEGGFEPKASTDTTDDEGGFEPEASIGTTDDEGGFEPEAGAPAIDADAPPPADATPTDTTPPETMPTETMPTETMPAETTPADSTPRDPMGENATPTDPAATPTDETPTDSETEDTADEETPAWLRVGDPISLTRREPLVKQFQFEASVRYGLVGTGPTRLVNDIRFGIFDWLELRTSLLPWPVALMARAKLGSQQGPLGAFIIDGGLANFDAGVRLIPEDGETEVGPRFHFEGGIAYARTLGPVLSIYAAARARYRLSTLKEDEQFAVAVDGHITYDLLPAIALTAGFGYAEVVGTPVRELTVNFVEVDRPGMSHFLLRNDGFSRSVTIPLALTYGRVDTFDVDLFVTTRVWPSIDVIFGAGLRWRIQLFELD